MLGTSLMGTSMSTDERQSIEDLFAVPEAPVREEKEDQETADTPEVATEESSEIGLNDDDLDALIGESQKEDEDQESESDPDPDESLDPKALAEKLGIGVDEIYGIKFNYGDDGESLSLGELKDLGVRVKTIEQEAETLEVDRISLENDNMTSRAEIQNIVSLLPMDAITPQLVAAARQQHDNLVRDERVALLSAIPAWNEPGAELAARGEILENLKQYGFREVEVNHMMDHRLIKMVHDFTRLKSRLLPKTEEVRSLRKSGRLNKPARDRSGESRRVTKAKAIGKTGDVRGAINAIFDKE
jgi:hypothetical protein